VSNSINLSFTPGALRIEPYSGFTLDRSSSTSVTAGDTPYRAQLTRSYHLADAMKTALESMQEAIGKGTTRSRAASVGSANDLGLSLETTSAVLRSAEEVNATPTSFSPFGPDWSGPQSSTVVTMDGVYDGDQGDDTLRFKALRNGTLGQDSLKMTAYDGSGQKIQSFTIGAAYVPGTVAKTLKNGLEVSFSAGTMKRNESFYVDVSTSVPSEVDPDKAFDGLRDDRPNFQYGLGVTAGSFDVNGTTIDVFANDTLNTVIDRINANVADVTATFDAVSETVVLTHDEEGAGHDISVGNDTSGFLEATKLDTAVLEPGRDGEARQVIEDVDPLDGVTTGTAFVNDVAISVDIGADSIGDVIDQVNASGAGVTMTLSADGQRVSLVADNRRDSITLADGDTNLWSELGLELGETKPRARSGIDSELMTEAMGDLKRALNGIFRDRAGESAVSAVVTGLRTNLRTAISTAFEADGSERIRSGFGVDFDFRAASDETMDYSRSRLRSALATDTSEVTAYFADGENGETGMLSSMISTLGGTMAAIEDTVGHIGLNVDVSF
jgi:hypothetical protein